MSKLKLIVGSTRPTRSADLVAPWVVARASAHEGFDLEVIDLRDWPLPFFAEHVGTIGDFSDPTYSEPIVKAWNNKINEADAYIIVTPEYNHSLPAVLKNAIDSVFVTFGFRNKPSVCVAYSGGQTGGSRAPEHLAQIALEAEMVPLRNNVLLPFIGEAFDEAGEPKKPITNLALSILLDDLSWWGEALKSARASGILPPAMIRQMAAQTAVAAAEAIAE